ncbi:glycosyl hydrolase family 85-domain-containing protein [Catenaria anguillulae PL171]|uniref:Glycosyl hydrolase family 85-domain-containing protein n=1 Tax=Catenaria anguillulae PL171 TaxID=765915 RepID=A0A1Y2HFL8_9FUNG|nr:glycosyl hydrolase family 85-domain-containing protein [Catenaria anguillulae PL171]
MIPESMIHGSRLSNCPAEQKTAVMDRRRKLMVCHDMMGGYTMEDGAPNGFASAEATQPARTTAFTVHHTALIDSFIYFSHHRVTVPPPQWTNLAHQCGSLSLGTLIFEWAESLSDLMLFMYGDAGLAWHHAFQLRSHKDYPMPPLPQSVSFDICDRIGTHCLLSSAFGHPLTP